MKTRAQLVEKEIIELTNKEANKHFILRDTNSICKLNEGYNFKS